MSNSYFYLPQNLTTPSILAVMAHPDDEAFLIGGTLADYALRGARVELLCLTHGEKGLSKDSCHSNKELARIRRAELQKSCELLGVKLLDGLALPDGELASLPLAELVRPIARTISARQSDIVITFGADGLTGHPDHIATSRATTLAFRQATNQSQASNQVLLHAGLSRAVVRQLSNRMEGSLGETPLQLTGLAKARLPIRVAIEHVAPLKWAALECHKSQSHNFEHITPADRALLSRYEYFRLAAASSYADTRATA